jgi:hypothetical protein
MKVDRANVGEFQFQVSLPLLTSLAITDYSIKREIGHLCHDEQRPKSGEKQSTDGGTAEMSQNFAPGMP